MSDDKRYADLLAMHERLILRHNLTAARLTRCERAIREILETIPPDGYTDTADIRAIARGVGIEPREASDSA